MKRKIISVTSNKTKDGLTEKQVMAMEAKKKKKPATHDMYGNKIIVAKPSAFEKKTY